ncbi:MAG: SsrA-binding protein SmpB [Candidatus Sumerlaeota bacterium]|nr:SsrA-binding protein SmpB [Candidatus Sumerlaeota bacterium]
MNASKPQLSSAPSIKQIATNRKARHLYNVLETFETGIALVGPEVKSLRAGQASLVDSYAQFQGGELFLLGMHIAAYNPANRWNPDPVRPRKLLMHRMEMKRLFGKTSQRGWTMAPLRLYFKGSHVKVELALVTGKKLHDKRETIKRRDQEREMRREMRESRK